MGADSDHFFSAGPLDPRRACSGKELRLFQFRKESFTDVHVWIKDKLVKKRFEVSKKSI